VTPTRFRFAPSPTGHLHVGNARTALFNWLAARHVGGTFLLRIEDTDTERSTAASERSMIDDLRWLGLDWDEGPDRGGALGPYRQSERGPWYQAAAADLEARALAYPCFCTVADLEVERQAALAAGEAPRYSGRCRALSPDDRRRRREAGEAAAVRFLVSPGHDVVVRDLVRGDVTFRTDLIGDFILLRTDGRPAYNFAVVVDDMAMAVTDVVRGEDHLSNTARQLLLYEALGAIPPRFAHVSLVLGPDHAPLSKRHGATSVAEFRAKGYLPEALRNYLALLGWSPGDGQEIVSLEQMVERFAVGQVTRSAAVFDEPKLAWINRHYLKAAPPDRIASAASTFLSGAGYLTVVTDAALAYVATLLPMVVDSVDRLDQVPARLAFIFDWDEARAVELVRGEDGAALAVRAMAEELADGAPDREAFRAAVARVRARTGLKGRALLHPVRAAVTAAEAGPELDLAIPAIDRGARLPASIGVRPIRSSAERLAAVGRAIQT